MVSRCVARASTRETPRARSRGRDVIDRRRVLAGGGIALAGATRAGAARARSTATVRLRDALSPAGGEVMIAIELPRGYHLTRGANSRFEVDSGEGGTLAGETTASGVARVNALGDAREVVVMCTVYFCRDDDVCLVQRVRFEVPVEEGGGDAARATFAVEPEREAAPAPEWNRFAVEL